MAAPVAVVQRTGWRQVLPWVAAVILSSIVTGFSVWSLKPTPPQLLTRTLVIPPASAPIAISSALDTDVSISPDGTRLVYKGSWEGEETLFVRAVNELEATRLSGLGSGVRGPFISPDGNWVGFFAGTGLHRVSIHGGPSVAITELSGPARGGTWGSDGTIIFGTGLPSGLWRVAAGGGDPEELTTPSGGGGGNHVWPEMLPGGSAVLFTKAVGLAGVGNSQIAVFSLTNGEETTLIPGGSYARYVPTGHIIYGAGGTLRAVGFDLDRLEVTTDPIPVVDEVNMKPTGAANFAVAENGSLVYVRGDTTSGLSSLVWRDREGLEDPLALEPGVYNWPRVSPDGTRVAVTVGNEDVWVSELARGTLSRVTTAPGIDNVPLWIPDSERVVFASMREGEGRFSFFQKRADGTGPAEKLLTSDGRGFFRPFGWSSDGTRMIFDYGPPPFLDVGVLTMEGEETWEPLLQSEANESVPELSPDGAWIAYNSDQTGQCEVYVQRFPDLGDRRQISTSGGSEAHWSPDGRELFYRESTRLMSVSIDLEPNFSPGSPEIVFDGLPPAASCLGLTYDLSPDGQRFSDAQIR